MPGEAPGQDRKAGVQAMQQPADPVYIREYNKAPLAEVPVASNQALFGYQNAPIATAPVEKVVVAQTSPMAAPIPTGNVELTQQPVIATTTAPVYQWYQLPFTRTFYTQRVIPRVRRVYKFTRAPRLVNWAKANKALAITLGISLLLLPLLAGLMAGRGPFGFYRLPWRSEAAKVEVHVTTAPAHSSSFMDWFLRRDHTETIVHDKHHHHKEHHDGLGATIAKSAALAKGAGIMKDAAANIVDKAKDTIDLAKDTFDIAKDSGSHMASKMWEAAKDTAASAATAATAAGSSSAGAWEKTKDAAERVVDRIMHPSGHVEEVHHKKEHISTHANKPVDVHVRVDQGGSTLQSSGFLARFLNRFALFRTLMRLTPLGILSLLGLMAIPLYLFFFRRPAAVIQQRPQVVPVVRPVGYTVVGGAGQQNIVPQQGIVRT